MVRAFALLRDISVSVACLTRLPIPASRPDEARPLAVSAWAFPVAGVLIGAGGGAVYAVGMAGGLTPLLAAILGVAAMIAATGAFHEDGLADTADGIGGGADSVARLRIMRDSRIGVFGAVAVMLSLVARAGAVAAIEAPVVAAAGLVAAGALSRAAVVATMHLLPPARPDGLGAAAGRPSVGVAAAAAGLGIAVALFVLPPAGAVAAVGAAIFGPGAVAALARRRLGGQTGDVLGATQQVGEIAVLVALAAIAGVSRAGG